MYAEKRRSNANDIIGAGVKAECVSGTRHRHWAVCKEVSGEPLILLWERSRKQCRNRVFVEDGDGIRTQAFDPSKLSDPSLIIYAPVRVLGNKTIVTNGDQTDTIYELMDKQMTFEQALRTREFEPDAPNYTPRISGIMHVDQGNYSYAMSILKSNNGNGASCNRYTFAYQQPVAGEGHFIHTYQCRWRSASKL